MYCTLDTPQVDMNKLLGNQLSFNHVIYVHIRGQTKEVRFLKSADALGLTVSDNKAGGVFVKRISNNGVVAKFLDQHPNSICPGDLIECINGRSFINSRHMDVVKYLKELPLNSNIVLRLISPEKSLCESCYHLFYHTLQLENFIIYMQEWKGASTLISKISCVVLHSSISEAPFGLPAYSAQKWDKKECSCVAIHRWWFVLWR